MCTLWRGASRPKEWQGGCDKRRGRRGVRASTRGGAGQLAGPCCAESAVLRGPAAQRSEPGLEWQAGRVAHRRVWRECSAWGRGTGLGARRAQAWPTPGGGPHFLFFLSTGAGAGSGAASAAFWTPSALAIMTNETPPTMLFRPRTTEVKRRKRVEGMMGCRICRRRGGQGRAPGVRSSGASRGANGAQTYAEGRAAWQAVTSNRLPAGQSSVWRRRGAITAGRGAAPHHVDAVEHLVAQVGGEAHVQRPAGGVAHDAGGLVLRRWGGGEAELHAGHRAAAGGLAGCCTRASSGRAPMACPTSAPQRNAPHSLRLPARLRLPAALTAGVNEGSIFLRSSSRPLEVAVPTRPAHMPMNANTPPL